MSKFVDEAVALGTKLGNAAGDLGPLFTKLANGLDAATRASDGVMTAASKADLQKSMDEIVGKVNDPEVMKIVGESDMFKTALKNLDEAGQGKLIDDVLKNLPTDTSGIISASKLTTDVGEEVGKKISAFIESTSKSFSDAQKADLVGKIPDEAMVALSSANAGVLKTFKEGVTYIAKGTAGGIEAAGTWCGKNPLTCTVIVGGTIATGLTSKFLKDKKAAEEKRLKCRNYCLPKEWASWDQKTTPYNLFANPPATFLPPTGTCYTDPIKTCYNTIERIVKANGNKSPDGLPESIFCSDVNTQNCVNLCTTSCLAQFPDPAKPIAPIAELTKELGGAAAETLKDVAKTGSEVFMEFLKPLAIPLAIGGGVLLFIFMVYMFMK
jgi:hypothetical protein